MASQHPNKTIPARIKAAKLLAKTFNTLDIQYLNNLLTEDIELDGDQACDLASGITATLSSIEKTINKIGSHHRPFSAEVARLQYQPRKYHIGISFEMDGAILFFISLETNKNGLIKSLYVHHAELFIDGPELTGDRPGFNLAKYESDKECLWAIRKETAKNLSVNNRPHFVAVIHESQDPERILLALDELTKNFDGSTCELLISSFYHVSNSGVQGELINYKSSADKALEEMGSAGYPTLGVMLGDECIRPGYRPWDPDAVISDLKRMGIPKNNQLKEHIVSVK